MQLTTLGGSAAWPNPGQGCSSYLVRHGDDLILLDCGPDTLHELRKHADLTRITAIVLSHMHADHMLDLVTYRYALAYGPGAWPDAPNKKITLWTPPGGADRLAMLAEAVGASNEDPTQFWHEVFDIREYDPGSSIDVGPFHLTFSPTQHFVPCNAIRVSTGDERDLVYTADTGEISSLVPFFRGAATMISEASVDDHGTTAPDERGHLTPEDAADLARRADVSMLVLSHLWSERPVSDVLRRARAHYDGPMAIAIPGATFDV